MLLMFTNAEPSSDNTSENTLREDGGNRSSVVEGDHSVIFHEDEDDWRKK